MQKAQPFSDELLAAIEQAKSRPVSPVYPQISQAIYKNVNQALSGAHEPGGRAQERAVRHGEGAEDVLMAAELVVLDRGARIGFSFRDLMSYHGPGSPGGVAHGFKVMERALPLLAPDGPPERREIAVRPRSAARARATRSSSCCARSPRGATRSTPRSRGPSAGGRASASCSALAYRGREVALGVREGFVTEEFLTLARTAGPGAGADRAARRAQARDGRAGDGEPC